jgi:hypothetical protein
VQHVQHTSNRHLARAHWTVVLTTLDNALCVPSLATAAMAKYQVPAARLSTVRLVVVGLSTLITSFSAPALVPYEIV